jgi:phosphatidate cytidylyltransferase
LLAARIITGAILGVVITITVFFLPNPGAAIVFGALWLAGSWEWASLATLGSARRVAYVAVVFGCMVLASLAPEPDGVAVAVAVATVWWSIALVAVLTYPRRFEPGSVAAIGLIVLVPSWLTLTVLHAYAPMGRALAMTVLLIVWAADIGAYGVGRWLGRVKLAPKVSPGKTWEGVSGGVAAAALVAWAAAALLGLPPVPLIAVGVGTALVSVVGDLTVRMFKRNVGLKVSGTLLPGHGGVMDRIDSLTAAVPIYALGLKLAGVLG